MNKQLTTQYSTSDVRTHHEKKNNDNSWELNEEKCNDDINTKIINRNINYKDDINKSIGDVRSLVGFNPIMDIQFNNGNEMTQNKEKCNDDINKKISNRNINYKDDINKSVREDPLNRAWEEGNIVSSLARTQNKKNMSFTNEAHSFNRGIDIAQQINKYLPDKNDFIKGMPLRIFMNNNNDLEEKTRYKEITNNYLDFELYDEDGKTHEDIEEDIKNIEIKKLSDINNNIFFNIYKNIYTILNNNNFVISPFLIMNQLILLYCGGGNYNVPKENNTESIMNDIFFNYNKKNIIEDIIFLNNKIMEILTINNMLLIKEGIKIKKMN